MALPIVSTSQSFTLHKNGDNWYIEDGINADTRAIDYMKKSKSVSNSETLKINLAPGGGWIAKVIKRNVIRWEQASVLL